MLVYAVEAVLTFLVVSGSATIAWGVRRFHLSTNITAIAFAITAASWVALLVTTIGITVKTFIAPSA
jgi:hypothetical protein